MATEIPISDPVEISTVLRDFDDGDGPGEVQRVAAYTGRQYLRITEAITSGVDSGASSGDLVCDPIDLGDQPRGMIRDLAVTLAAPIGTALPAIDVLVIQIPIGYAVNLFGEAGAPPENLASVGFAVRSFGWSAADFTPKVQYPSAMSSTMLPRVEVDDGAGPDDPTNVRLVALLIAAETFADDLSAGMYLAGAGDLDFV